MTLSVFPDILLYLGTLGPNERCHTDSSFLLKKQGGQNRTILVYIVEDQQPASYKDTTHGWYFELVSLHHKLGLSRVKKHTSFLKKCLHKIKCFKTRLQITNKKLEVGPFVSKNKGPQ